MSSFLRKMGRVEHFRGGEREREHQESEREQKGRKKRTKGTGDTVQGEA